MQEQFIKYLKAKSQDNTSFVEDIASVLDVGYDAAYRRVNNKTNLSLEESVILARHYKISLNKLFEVGNQNTIITEVSPRPKDFIELEAWMTQSFNNLYPLSRSKNATFIYAAKDIPVFHTLKDSYLSRYKMYVWLKDINVEMNKNQVTFDDFINTIPESLLQSAYKTSELYKNINISEIWTDTTINGSLNQVSYYYEAGLLSKELALHICDDFKEITKNLEKMAINQSFTGSRSKESKAVYNLYLNEVHTLSNQIMIVTPQQKAFFAPFTVLTYFRVTHQPTCELMHEFLQSFMSHSKLLVNTGEKDRTLFFNRMDRKISTLRDQINANDPFKV